MSSAAQQKGFARNRQSHVARIREYLMDSRDAIELTAAEAATYARIKLAMTLRIDGNTSNQAATRIVKTYHVSNPQAHRDVQNAITLYGDTTLTNKHGHRHVASEMALKVWRVAIENEDVKGAVAAAALYAKIHSVDKDDPQEFDYSKLQQHLFAITLDEVSRKAIEQGIDPANGVMDFSKLYATVAVDVESEPVTETATDEPT